MNNFPILLKREFWEHRGGLLWAPVWTAITIIVFALIGWAVGEWALLRHGDEIHVGMNLTSFMQALPDDKLPELKRGFDIGLLGLATVIRVVLMFVVFFYCIGCLYDERRDRSVLFWKSMPVSDSATVLAKLATAALVAPMLAFAAVVVMHVAFLLVLATVTLVHGGSPMRMVFGPAEPLALWAKLLVSLPVASLWALPSFGWLMFASSFARGKAFLWAVVPPVLLGVMSNIFDLMQSLSLPSSWIWVHVVARLLPLGIKIDGNGGDMQQIGGMQIGNDGPELLWSEIAATLVNPETLIGAVVGAALIAGAIHFRRTRELAD